MNPTINNVLRDVLREMVLESLGGTSEPVKATRRSNGSNGHSKRGQISAAGRAAIGRASKRRWAEFRRAKAARARKSTK